MQIITNGIPFRISCHTSVSSSMFSSHTLEHQGLIANYNACRFVAGHVVIFELPRDFTHPGVSSYATFQINIGSFSYIRLRYGCTQCQINDRSNYNGKININFYAYLCLLFYCSMYQIQS